MPRRRIVVLLAFLSVFVCYMDRVNISVAIIPMAEDLGWSPLIEQSGKTAVGEPVTIGLRPEHLLEGGGGDASLEGRVIAVEQLGGETFAYVEQEGPEPLVVKAAGDATGMPVVSEIMDAAERHNDPGTFTSFLGWEWSSTPNGANLHRVIVMREGRMIAELEGEDLTPETLVRHAAGIEGSGA